MHLKVIACEVLAREFFHCAASARHTTDIKLLTQGLHDNADTCRAQLQAEIDGASPEQFDAVILGYGLCNNSLAGIRAGQVRVVIPRAHDCITLLLGSKERYAERFAVHPGTYYYSSGWIECETRGGERVAYSQKSGLAKRLARQELIEKYGEENGQYLFAVSSQWEVNYTHGALIRFPFTAGLELEEKVRAICEEKIWSYMEVDGDLRLIRHALAGQWNQEDFLIVEPGGEITACYDDNIIGCKECSSA